MGFCVTARTHKFSHIAWEALQKSDFSFFFARNKNTFSPEVLITVLLALLLVDLNKIAWEEWLETS